MIYPTAEQMEKLDELAVANGLEIRQMMELAGFAILEVFKRLRVELDQKVTVVAGKGNKGGDGLAAARHLTNHGWKVEVVLIEQDLKTDPQHQLRLLEKMKIPIRFFKEGGQNFSRAQVIIDSLIGYHLFGAPREPFAAAIREINASQAKVIAYDVPSGIDVSSGDCPGECVKADATLTLAVPKRYFETDNGRKVSGRVFLADIGIPEFLYRRVVPHYKSPFVGEGGVRELN